MKRFLAIIYVALLSVLAAHAQDEILVTGHVTSTVDDGPLSGTRIFIFKTVGEGNAELKRAMETYETFYEPDGAFAWEMSQSDGYYEAKVPAGGALLFYQFPFKPVLEKVKGRSTINVKIEATTVLDDAVLTEEGKKKTKKGRPVARGLSYFFEESYYFDEERMGEVEGVGKTNARLISQVFLVNSDGTDTVRYFPPRVYDGEQFHKTQYHWSNDYLYEMAEGMPRLTEDKDSLKFSLKFDVDDPTALYFVKANIWIEDYIKTYYQDSVTLFNTGRVSRPEQFLEYTFDQCHLDSKKYFKPPRRELISTPKNMKLQFQVGEAELDRTDAATMAALDSLKEEIRAICNDPAAKLKELHFTGVSSPDGTYAKNKDLSQRRIQTVRDEIWSVIPRDRRDMVYSRPAEGFVATWSDVADLLEKKGVVTEAEAVREIVAKYPDNMDRQGTAMKGLPFYNDKIKPVLPELRSVKCEHVAEVNRFLEPSEILAKFNKNKNWVFTLNEYWHLFELVKDEKDLESLYKRALAASMGSERKLWPLPANNLAVQKLKRKEVDTLLLAPFINEKYRANQPWRDANGNADYDRNPDAIVANQVQMLMMAKNYERAEELSSIIANEHPMLRAIVRCLGGYIDFADPAEQATIDMIKSSSPRNEVIVNMFYREVYDSVTVAALKKLPSEEPLTDYIRAQYLCLKHEGDVVKMKSVEYDRTEDPVFVHSKDEIVEPATPEEIEAQKEKVAELQSFIDSDIAMGLTPDDLTKSQLEQAKATLAVMEKGETSVIPVSITVYEAASEYLKHCFAKDKKFVRIAQADYDIAEELLNDVLGIKKEKQ